MSRNIQNRITQESIFTALMILMEQKSLEKISVTELTRLAGVSRMAFYRNYVEFEDIIINHLDEFFEEYSTRVLSSENNFDKELVCFYFAYFRKHEKLITNLIHSNLTNLLLDSGVKFFYLLSRDILCKKSHSPEREHYSIEFIVGGLSRVLIEWAKNGMEESDDDMAELVSNLLDIY